MSDHTPIGNRHLLPVQGCQDAAGANPQVVRIVVADNWALSYAGQLLVSCLVNLLVRQVGYVRRVEIICAQAPCLIHLPGVATPKMFAVGLVDLASWAVNGAVEVSLQPTFEVDQLLYIGAPPSESIPAHVHALCALGNDWRAWVGDAGAAPLDMEPLGSNPIGPFLAAALLAGEVFKHSRGIVRGRYLTSHGYSLWSGNSSPSWHELEAGPGVAGISLPPIHLVGAGAVGNVVAYIASYLGLAAGVFVSVDDDHYDATNLNRCLLGGWADLGHPKVQSLHRVLRAAGVGSYPFVGTIKDYLTDPHVDLRGDIVAAVDDLRFEVVLSCVDKGTSRQDLQGLSPELLLGGSTLNLQAKANRYGARFGSACLGCFNRAERDGERIRALEAHLRNLPPEERRTFLKSNNLPDEAIEQYLSGAPCGSIGEAALKDFATRMPAQFSAGFVSLGAGLLLVAELLKNTAFAQTTPPRSDMTTLNFLNGGFLESAYAADPECELGCQEYTVAVP